MSKTTNSQVSVRSAVAAAIGVAGGMAAIPAHAAQTFTTSDSFTGVRVGTPQTLDVISNDYFSGSISSIFVRTVGSFSGSNNGLSQRGGTLTVVTAGGHRQINYTPPTAAWGNTESFRDDYFYYGIDDEAADTDGYFSSPARVDVRLVNQAPVAANDFVNTQQGTPVVINVLANDSDREGQSFQIVSRTTPANGTAVINTAANAITYTPSSTFTGPDSFTYTIADYFGNQATATVLVDVWKVNPIAAADSFTGVRVGTPQTLDVLGNDYFSGSISSMFVRAVGATPGSNNGLSQRGGTLTVVTAGGHRQINYTPPTAAWGNTESFRDDYFYYGIDDEAADTDGYFSSPARVDVRLVNQAPVAVDDSGISTRQGTPVVINVLANDSDREGQSFQIVSRTTPANGTAVINTAANAITYTPSPAFTGPNDTFTYTIADYFGNQATATVTVNVVRNEIPIAAIAGGNRTVIDSNGVNGENVIVNGAGSSDTDGTIALYRWSVDSILVPGATGPQPTLALSDGTHTVSLEVVDNENGVSNPAASVTITVSAPRVPVPQIAGGDRTLADTDSTPGMSVQFTGSATDPDGTVAVSTYRWSVNGTLVAAANGQATPTLPLNAGANQVTLLVTDNSGLSASTTVNITIGNAPVPQIAGGDRTLADTDSTPGMSVQFTGSATDPDGTVAVSTYRWSVNGTLVAAANGQATPTLPLNAGANQVTLLVTDNSGFSASTTVNITIGNAPVPQIAGGDRTLADTDSTPGMSVQLTGSATDPDGTVAVSTYRWSVNGTLVAAANGQATPTLPLNAGANQVTLLVTDNSGLSASTTVNITVARAPVPKIAEGDRTLPDGDDTPGMSVLFTGSATDTDGTVAESTYRWFVNDTLVAAANGTTTPTLALNAGANRVTLQVTDSSGLSASVTVNTTVGAPNQLSSLAGLDDNQRSVANELEGACSQLLLASSDLTAGQQELQRTCKQLFDHISDTSSIKDALTQISGQVITAYQTTAVDFSSLQLTNLSSRLRSLRQGATGTDFTGLNLETPGLPIPLPVLASIAKAVFGGGGSGDDDGETGQSRWGFFVNGSVRIGEKDATSRESGFEFDTKGVTAGADYRFSDKLFLGVAAGYGAQKTEFDANGGRFNGDSYTGSFYGSFHADRGFIDWIASYGKTKLDSVRNINLQSLGIADSMSGSTDGRQLGLGVSGGFDFNSNGFQFGPTAGFNYVDADIDAFAEAAANGNSGLALAFGDQTAKSLVVRTGGQLSYAWSVKWGVLSPHVQFDLLKELENKSQTVKAAFVNAPAAVFSVNTDEPDTFYMTWSVGLSAQFKGGVAGFINYETVKGLDTIKSQEFTVGLRIQRLF